MIRRDVNFEVVKQYSVRRVALCDLPKIKIKNIVTKFLLKHSDKIKVIRQVRWPKWFIFLLRYEFSIPNSEF